MTNKQQMLMQSITHFFETNHDLFREFYDIVKPTSKISLRVIDWFITNFSRVHDVSYQHPTKPGTMFAVHDSYKSQLKAYSKRQFDPFCRRMRINFHFSPTEKVVTTVGQLNFFRWAIENGVMDYIKQNFSTIEKHMKTFVRDSRETKRQQHTKMGLVTASKTKQTELGDTSLKQKKNIAGGTAISSSSSGGNASTASTGVSKTARRRAPAHDPNTNHNPPTASSNVVSASSSGQVGVGLNVLKQKKSHTVYFH